MMTFTEAAVHVLRLVGKPLHYKEITDVAIEKDLLSHVGKSPEVTMGARLAAVVKKGGKDNLLARAKPGVFALAEWDAETIEKGLLDRTPALERLIAAEKAEAEKAAQQETSAAGTEPPARESSAVNLPVPSLEDDHTTIGADEKARAELSAAATALFEAEDDDDEPILGPAAEEEEEDDARRPRGRGRRRRGREREDDGLPSYTVSDAYDEAAPDAAQAKERSESRPERSRDRGERDASRNNDRGRDDASRNNDRGRDDASRNNDRGREDRDAGRNERDRGRDDRPRDDRGRDERPRDDRGRDERGRDERRVEDSSDPVAVVEACLQGFRRTGAAPLRQLSDAVARRIGGSVDPSWVSALVRADNLRKQADHDRPRFRVLSGNRLALTEWGLERDSLQLEKNVRAEAERLRATVRKQLLRRINELPQKAAQELWMVLLERLGYTQFKVVRRPNAHSAELHWSAVHQSAGGDVPVAIIVRRDSRDLGRERVTELRGSLHHYGAAAMGLLITTAQVMSGAREEATAPFATPVHFLDGAKVSELCEQYGVGVVPQYVSVPALDMELFESLRSGQ